MKIIPLDVLDQIQFCWMTELEEIFEGLGLRQYLDVFIEQGFDTWDTILDITESDFDALGVKLGHRRKLQRRIANSRGLSSDQALKSPTRSLQSDERQADDSKSNLPKTDARDGNTSSGKRKYRRHPKPDENAPERPPSAYVIFSNKMRIDLKGRHLSFTEIAKLVGENWQNLSPKEKKPYEAQALMAKEKYNSQLAQYKSTLEYSKYIEYLQEFKEKQANLQNTNDASKRPKLEHQISNGSSGAGSSVGSQQGADGAASLMNSEFAQPTTVSKFSAGGSNSTMIKESNLTGTGVNQSGASGTKEQNPSLVKQSSVLPGYRESMYSNIHQQTLAWRDNTRPDASAAAHFSRVTALEERRPGYFATSPIEYSSQPSVRSQSDSQMSQTFSPPPLNSDSTIGTTISSGSNTSSLQYMPRTPLELPLDRPLAIAPLYSSKSYENQLPPIRAISLPPQTSVNVTYTSPSGALLIDYPPGSSRPEYISSHHSEIRSPSVSDHAARLPPLSVEDEEPLDPVSALLKADEIVNRTSWNRPPG